MEFCPRCGAIMLPHKNRFKCKCGYEKKITKELSNKYKMAEKIEIKNNIIFTGGEVKTLPTIKVECPKCGNKEAFWWLQQTRRADEAETRFLRCTKCKYTWREYD